MGIRLSQLARYLGIAKPRTLLIAVCVLVIGGVVANIYSNALALTGTLYPDGEVTTGWPTLGGTDDASCAGSGYCSRIDEATLDTGDYISTGSSSSNLETLEFTMQNPDLTSTPSVDNVTVNFHANTVACVNTSDACDRVEVSISMDNGSTWTAAQSYDMTTTPTTYKASFSGSWSGADNMRIRFVRSVLMSTGSPKSNYDDVRLYQANATFTYVSNTNMELSAYRWFNNQDSATPATNMAAQDTAITASPGQQIRLRLLAHVSNDNLVSGGNLFKLQYAEKSGTCDTSFNGEIFKNISSSSPITYYDNASIADGAAISSTPDDPTHITHTTSPQTYVESNSIGVNNTVVAGQDGMWDFSLAIAGDAPISDFCLRLVNYDGTMLTSYTAIPEVQLPVSVSSIAPTQGPITGGTPFLLTGSFGSNATVTIGGVAAADVIVIDGSTLIGVTPAGTNGAQDVVVSNGSTSDTLIGGFTYSSLIGAHTKSSIADFSNGTLSGLRNGTLEISNGTFVWQDYTPSNTGGSIGSGTYYYAVTAMDAAGNETTRSIQTPGVSVSGPTGSVSLKWLPITGAYGYKVYRSTTSGTYNTTSLVATLDASSSSPLKGYIEYFDTSSSTNSGQPPTTNNTVNAGLFMSRGTVPNGGIGTMTTGPAVVGSSGNTVGQGAHFLERPDGTYLLIQGNNAQNTSIYNPSNNSFSAGPSTGVNSDWGTLSFKIPDGRYYVMFGNTTATRYYDPVTNTFSTAPSLTTSPLWGAHVMSLENGNFLIIPGNDTTATSIYDVTNDTVSSGPTLPATSYVGSHAIKRPDGKWLLVRGGSTTTYIYDESANTFSSGPALIGSCNSGCGAIERPDGRWLILHGTASTTTDIYNPISNTVTAGPALPGTTHDGQNELELPDGRWLIIRGNATSGSSTNDTYIYDPYGNSFSSGPLLTGLASAETPWLQRPDGTFLIMHGNNSATSSIYDAGWITGSVGSYESEAMHPDEARVLRQISWTRYKDAGFQIEYRAARSREDLSSATYDPATNGQVLNESGKNWMQLRIVFTREIADNGSMKSNNTPGVWGLRSSKSYRWFTNPAIASASTIYDIAPNNKIMRHRKFFSEPGTIQYYSTE